MERKVVVTLRLPQVVRSSLVKTRMASLRVLRRQRGWPPWLPQPLGIELYRFLEWSSCLFANRSRSPVWSQLLFGLGSPVEPLSSSSRLWTFPKDSISKQIFRARRRIEVPSKSRLISRSRYARLFESQSLWILQWQSLSSSAPLSHRRRHGQSIRRELY